MIFASGLPCHLSELQKNPEKNQALMGFKTVPLRH